MLRHFMISTIFLKNRLSRLLKPIVGKSTPGYMVEKRHEFGEMTVALVSAILVYKLLIEDAPSAPRQRLVAVQVGNVIVSYGSKGVF